MPSPVSDARSADARTDLIHVALFALAYFAGSEIGYALSLGPSVGGTFWPPSGIALAALLVAPYRSWPLLLLAGAGANFGSDALHGQILPASLAFAVANLSEPLIGAWLLRTILRGPIRFTRLVEVAALAVVAVLISTPVAAAIGALAAQWWTPNPPGFAAGWRTWWVGDAVGALVLTPLVVRVVVRWREARAIAIHRWVEAAAFALILWSVTQVVFTAPPTSLAMPFLVFPVLMWGSLRFGPIGVGGALCLIVLLTAHDTVSGRGPFAAEHLSVGGRLIALQTYVGVMALSFHGLGVLWGERSRTAAALELAHSSLEARHRRIVEQAPLAIVTLDPSGRVKDANPAWRRLWSDSHHARPETGITPWEDPALWPMLDRAFTGETVALPERELVVPDDPGAPTRRLRGVAYPISDEDGGVTEVVLIARDITEEVQAQQQLLEANRALREREEALSHALRQMAEAQAHREQLLDAERFARGEAERASTLKEEFLATLSHELRTPLNAIVGWAHILRRSAQDPALSQAVDTIERNARAQAKLIDDLLDMSRIMAGKVGLSMTRVRLAEVVTSAADALRPAADAKGVELAVDVRDTSEVWIACDTARLQQVMTNLLGNGIKFTSAGGRVDVCVTVRGDAAQIGVRDTGQGIPAEFLPSVFERFRQADGSFSRRHGGLGLGLSIARQIVEMHLGSIGAASDGPGMGASFTVTLPLVQDGEADAGDPGEGSTAIPLAGMRVLVVDDEADARELLRRLLLEHGCEVACAGSAHEALTQLAAQPCDVLLTDIGMPGTDGYELLRRVRAGMGPQPRAVAVTAFARPQDRERAAAAGFDGHLAKPVDPARLLQMLWRVATPPSSELDSDAAFAPPRTDPPPK
jgi:signal transduction histidine kinase/integral membrane sensor domain MASE1/ActR/RegA family two-component response regulator